MAIAFRENLRDHPSVGEAVGSVVDFLKDPGVPGVASLVQWSQADAAFAYRTGNVLTVTEILRAAPRVKVLATSGLGGPSF